MDRLFAMKVFVQVVDTGSFSKAALALNLPAPSVSRLVQSLEAHLAVRLLNRTTRSVRLTDDGRAYYERCVRVLDDIDEMEAGVGRSRRSASGRVRVSLPGSVAKGVLIPALPAFVAAYPDVTIDLVVSDRPVDLVGESLDCAIRVGNVISDEVVSKRAGDAWNIVCASPAYLAAHGEPATLDNLQQHIGVHYISQVTGRVQPWDFSVDGNPHALRMKSVVTVDDADAYVACGVAGLGIVCGSFYSLRPQLESGGLRRILAQYEVSPRPVHVIYRPDRHLPRKTRVFIDWFCGIYGALSAQMAGPA
ncbi:LysR family transcriptional regulator [Burkholderia sp. 22PA0106]|uniref:LysR family transcriptional regulator n=1 Tax=Burkholderia sp. 22PA0106 TaxID=3237371 RepID=UPI0039C1F860